MIYPNKPLYLLSLLGYIYYLTCYTLTTKDNMSKGRGFLVAAEKYRLTSSFLIGRTPSYGYAISPRRAEHIVLYAVCLSPTNSVELQIFIAPKRSLWIWNPHSQV